MPQMQIKLLQRLDLARAIAHTPFIINSAIRCKPHNTASGGRKASSHLGGWAVDIKADNSPERYKILTALIKAGFNRLGVYQSFIHADCDPSKAPEVIWAL